MKFIDRENEQDPPIWSMQDKSCLLDSRYAHVESLKREVGKTYTFDKIFTKSEELENVYDEFIKQKVMSSLDGQNACVFAYGGH